MEITAGCTCGHALAVHDYDGCAGERLRACPCRRDRKGLLTGGFDLIPLRSNAALSFVRAAGPDAA